MLTRRIGLVAVTAALAATPLAVQAAHASSAKPKAQKAPAPAVKTIAIGIKFDQPGMGFVGQDGKPHGFDVDVATYVAKFLGFGPDQIKWVQAPSEQRERLIENGTVKFIVASYSMTPEREKLVTFAGPYFVAGQNVLVRSGNTSITGPASLNGKTVCTAEGSTSAQQIRKFAPQATVITKPTYSECVDHLLAGHIDAVTTDDVILAGYAAANPGKLKLAGGPFTKELYGIGLEKGDAALQEKITAAIAKMIKSGAWQRAVNATISPSGYKVLPPPPVFNVPADVHISSGIQAGTDLALVQAADELITESNARQWHRLEALTCPQARSDLNDLVKEFTPQYDTNLNPGAIKDVGFRNTLTGLRPDGAGKALLFAHEQFTHVPSQYERYFNPIDYAGTLIKEDGAWKLCGLAAHFVGA